jgi:hypothetical protein
MAYLQSANPGSLGTISGYSGRVASANHLVTSLKHANASPDLAFSQLSRSGIGLYATERVMQSMYGTAALTAWANKNSGMLAQAMYAGTPFAGHTPPGANVPGEFLGVPGY